MCVIGYPYNHPPPEALTLELTIQFIEFTYCNDRFATRTLTRKTTKYQAHINNITSRGWNVAPLTVLAVGAIDTTHTPSMKNLETKVKIPITKSRDIQTNKHNHCTFYINP
jgi:hypothetical protein